GRTAGRPGHRDHRRRRADRHPASPGDALRAHGVQTGKRGPASRGAAAPHAGPAGGDQHPAAAGWRPSPGPAAVARPPSHPPPPPPPPPPGARPAACVLRRGVGVAAAAVGGFWPAVAAPIGASLLITWYSPPPLHTLTIDQPRNLLALLLFVTVAVTVSSVV